jgi:hypothetical protein
LEGNEREDEDEKMRVVSLAKLFCRMRRGNGWIGLLEVR